MSDMEQLKASVLKQAHKKGQERLAEATEQLKEAFSLKEKQALQDKAAQRERQLDQLKRYLQREEQQLQNQERQSTLVTKNAVLKELFKAAEDKMSSWSGDEQVNFLKTLLAPYQGQELTVQLGELTRNVFNQGHWDKLAQAFPQVTFVAEGIAGQAGMIVSSGQVDDNFLYSSLVQSLWNDESYQMANAIFTQD